MKILYQGVAGSYSESCAKKMYPDCETISCNTFDECFEKASKDPNRKDRKEERENLQSVIPRNQIAVKKLGETLFKFGSNHKVIRSSESLMLLVNLALPPMQTRKNFDFIKEVSGHVIYCKAISAIN